MKKILQINTTLNKGSHGRIAEQIGVLGTKKGYKVYFGYSRHGESSLETIKIGNFVSQAIHLIITRILDLHPLGSYVSTLLFTNKIRKIDPDIIHIHNFHGYYLNFSLFLKFLQNFKGQVVWTLHDCWLFTGHCAYFDYVQCTKWKNECYKCPQKKSYPKSIVLDNSKYNYRLKKKLTKLDNITYIPVSNWLNHQLNMSFLGTKRRKVIHNGIDLNSFKKLTNITNSKTKIILGVANKWEKRKGFDDFLKLSRLISSQYEITLVGLSNKQMDIIKEYPNINGITKVENTNELNLLYNKAYIFFNPTLEDNYPTTNLEAMSAGTPVVTYNTGGSPESIIEGSGLVINKGDLASVINFLNTLNDDSYKKMSEICIEHALTSFDSEKCYEKYMKLYEKLLK